MPDSHRAILAVETSGHQGDLALQTASGEILERSIGTNGRRHAQTLVAEVDELLQAAQLQPQDVDLVAVSHGPGSFTGLRVGVVFAKTFAWANQAKLVAVDTLQATACAACASEDLVTAISDAQRSELFVNRYSTPDTLGIRSAVDELSIISVSDLASQFTHGEHGILTGPGLMKFSEKLSSCTQTASTCWQPQAQWVLRAGLRLAESGQYASLSELEPVYVRRSYAEEKKVAP